MLKKLLIILPLAISSLLSNVSTVLAKDIVIPFAKGSYCGAYGGRVNVGDNFVLNLAPEQQLIITKFTPHDYSVIAPNGEFLEVITRFPDGQNQYWTGNQSGNFKIRVNSVPEGLQMRIKFCAYTGEGAL